MSGSIKVLCCLLTCLALLMTSCVETEPASDAWINACEMSPDQCVATCQKDPLFCAQQINGYLLESVNGGPRSSHCRYIRVQCWRKRMRGRRCTATT